MTSLYQLRAARARFPDGTALALPSLEVAPGERIAVVGPNGSGKTSLLRVLAFLQVYDGELCASVAPEEVAFVSQRPYLFRGTVAANLALAACRLPRWERARRVREALERLGAGHLGGRRRGALSTGELQRVALARALVARPRVLLLDEPLGPLDGEGAARLAGALAAEPSVTVVAAAPTAAGAPLGAGARTLRLG